MPIKIHIDEQELRYKHLEEGLNREQLAAYFNCSVHTITKNFKQYNIKARIGRSRAVLNKGDRFDRLVITGITQTDKNCLKWECNCDCGNTTYVQSTDLIRGHTKTCGNCLDKAYETGLNYLYNTYIRGAKQRQLAFELTKEQFNNLISNNCYYCNSKPKQILYKDGMKLPFIYNGVDRIDNNVGYIKGNSISCCKFCNMAKGKDTVEEFEEWIQRLIEYRLSLGDTKKNKP